MNGYLATFMLKRKLAGKPGKTFFDFIKMAHDFVEVRYMEGEHYLNIPEAYLEFEDSSGSSQINHDIDDLRELLVEWLVEKKLPPLPGYLLFSRMPPDP